MSPVAAIVVTDRRPPALACRGFTLLEVLVSMGIIIGALAGIAALLPAAGSRLGEATEIDQAGTLAANAVADLTNRGLFRASLWTGATPAVVFGQGLTDGAVSFISGAGVANQAELAARIDPDAGFFLADSTASGGAARICYGCMLSGTASGAPAAGTSTRVTTVVFRNPTPQLQTFSLSQSGSNSTVFSSATTDADRKRFLAGCAWVVALPATVGVPPLWVPIASSWTTGSTFVSFADSAVLSGSNYVSGSPGTLQVIGFDGLLRVDERFVTLE